MKRGRLAVAGFAALGVGAACNGVLGIGAPIVVGPDAATDLDAAAVPEAAARDGAGADALAASDALGPDALDLTTDPHNCGAVGHDCLGAACFASLCGSTIFGHGVGGGIVASGAKVFWSDVPDEVVQMASADGGAPTILFGANAPGAIAASPDGATLYVYDGATLNVSAVAVATGVPSILMSGNEVTQLAASTDWVAATITGTGNDGAVVALANPFPDGGDPLKLAGGQPLPFGTVIAGSAEVAVFWADEGQGAILSADFIDMPVVATVLAQQPAPYALAASGGDLVLTNRGASGNVVRVPQNAAGQLPGFVLADQQNDPVALAADDTYAYWLNQGDGTVNRVPVAGGPVLVLAKDSGKLDAIAIDAQYVYWTNLTVQTVRRVAR